MDENIINEAVNLMLKRNSERQSMTNVANAIDIVFKYLEEHGYYEFKPGTERGLAEKLEAEGLCMQFEGGIVTPDAYDHIVRKKAEIGAEHGKNL